jgi:putative ABC transport system ATP-binding protein
MSVTWFGARMTGPLITARGLAHWYVPPTSVEPAVLRGIDVDVRAGEMLSIVGPSGSGKTTLLTCLSALERPRQGTLSIEGKDVLALSQQQLAKFRRGRIGFLFQQYNLLPALTVAENILIAARLARRPADRATVETVLAAVGLQGVSRRLPAQLSGGQQQRAALARALATRPRVLFADEPTGALDSRAADVVLGILRTLATADRSVVMVTHNLEAAALGDRVLVLGDGQIRAELERPTARQVFEAVEAAGVRA